MVQGEILHPVISDVREGLTMTTESPEPTVKEQIRKAQKEAYLVSLVVGLFALWMGYYWVTPNDAERFWGDSISKG